jgi:hypothetical protein
VLSATLVVALAAFTVGAAPAQAGASGPPCGWTQFHTASNCDGIVMDDALWEACGRESIATIYWLRINGPGGVLLGYVGLDYLRGSRTSAYPGGVCRVAAASVGTANTAASCYAKVVRNSDGQEYATYNGNGFRSQSVYDAGVTSYAWGVCSYNGGRYSVRTPGY